MADSIVTGGKGWGEEEGGKERVEYQRYEGKGDLGGKRERKKITVREVEA